MPIVRKILDKLFGKTSDHRNQTDSSDLPSSPVCAFCGKAARDKWSMVEQEFRLRPQPAYDEVARMWANTAGLWECMCGAIGSGAVMDFVDAVDRVLAVLGIEFPANEVRRIKRDHFDQDVVLRELLRLQNYELGLNSFQPDSNAPPVRCLSVRNMVP